MANVNAPNGFQRFGSANGAAPSLGNITRKIAQADTTPIGYGDPVTSLVTGYVTRSTAGTTQWNGIFLGCYYLNTAVGRVVWSRNWPGTSAGGDAVAFIDDDPNALYVGQSNGSPFTFADINANVNFAIGTPDSVTGFSTSSLNQSTINTTNTLAFRIVGLLSQWVPPNSENGTDDASNFNRAIVRPNFTDRTSLVGMAS